MFQGQYPSERVVAAIGSMTAAVQAQRALAAAGLAADVVALSPGDTRRGCAYGVEYPAAAAEAARRALRAAGVRPTQFLQKGRGRG